MATHMNTLNNIFIAAALTGLAACSSGPKGVRIENGGAGLMFKDFDATAFRALQKVMRYNDSIK